MKRFAAIVLALATTASAQPAGRRATSIGALMAYPGYYHSRQVTVIGTVTTTDAGLRLSDDSGSIRIVSKGPAPDGIREVRGDFWDIGRFNADDPRLSGYDLKSTFNVDPDRGWPRQGDVTALIVSAVREVPTPAAPSIRNIVLYPSRYIDQKVTVTGQFGGRNLFGDLPDSPGKSRYDFVLRSADAAIWISGAQPKGKGFNLALDARLDTGRWLDVTGIVRTGRGLQWLEVGANDIQLGKALIEAPADTEPTIRVPAAPPPEVVFSAPTQDETDVSLTTNVRIQFSRNLDPTTLKGRVHARYLESQTAERGEPTTPTAEFTIQYQAPNRVLEVRFAKPLERFRTLIIELSDGILGTDMQPLAPWTLRFDLGG